MKKKWPGILIAAIVLIGLIVYFAVPKAGKTPEATVPEMPAEIQAAESTEVPAEEPADAQAAEAPETVTAEAAETVTEEAAEASVETAAEIPTEESEAVQAADESAAEDEPVLLASVNGDEIWSNNEDMQELVNYYNSYYNAYGYDTSDPMFQSYVQAAGLEWAIESALYAQKAEELNVTEMTEEQQAELEKAARAEWEEAVSYYTGYLTDLPDDASEEDTAAARLNALSYIETNYGYTEESYVAEYVEESRVTQMRKNVQTAVLGETEVTDQEIEAYFNSLVEDDKATYEGNVPMYEYYTNYMGSNSYYVPEGYRGITHILLEVDSDLMNAYTALVAKLEEQQSETAEEATGEDGEKATEEAAETTAAAEETAETTAADGETVEAAAETDKAEEQPVTQEQVDAAKQAILDSVKPTVDEIMAKYEAGTPFADLIAEYGKDPGMESEPNRTNGYAVHKESILWDPAFTEGAMALEKVGDVSEPVLGSYGIHLLHYTRDIPGGAVELTDEIKAQLKEELEEEKESGAIAEMIRNWRAEAELIYTAEGQAILDAAEKTSESVETTDATEDALTGE